MGKEVATLRKKFRILRDVLDERGRRVWAAAEANALPRGGVSLVAEATGLSRSTIHAGLRELKSGRDKAAVSGRIRRAGGGRKPLTFHQPDLLKALEQLVEPLARGDPESFLRWSSKSTRHLAQELQRQGYSIGDRKVAGLLHQMGYSLQANAKTLEGNSILTVMLSLSMSMPGPRASWRRACQSFPWIRKRGVCCRSTKGVHYELNRTVQLRER